MVSKPGLSTKTELFKKLSILKETFNLLQARKTDELVFLAEYKKPLEKDKTWLVRIHIFNIEKCYHKVFQQNSVNYVNDWIHNDKLWFRLDNQNEFEAFIEYQEDFRDYFVLKDNQSLLTFLLEL